MDPRLAINRRNWNDRVPVHAASSFYDVAGFKAGRISLNEIEREEVGPVAGKSLLHLQCHFGMDTMSWSRLSAKDMLQLRASVKSRRFWSDFENLLPSSPPQQTDEIHLEAA